MKQLIQISLIVAAILGLNACNEGFLYYNELPQKTLMDKDIQIKSVINASQLDILWIIDNSGSMGDYQQAVIQNTSTFMSLFTQKKLNWKMGLISTDISDPPYIGFTPTAPLDYKMPDAVQKFQAAVGAVGTSGSGYEMTFSPLIQTLKNYPAFIRPGAALAVIVVTDAQEQSPKGTDWLKEFKALSGNSSAVYGYGVFAAKDLGCTSSEGPWNFFGGDYENFFKGLDGYKSLKICDPNFGQVLSEISQDLVQKTAYYWIPLPFRPKTRSIVVSYKDQPLKAGPQDQGGLWYYNYDKNAVIFYDLDFAGGDTESVHVYAVEDDGIEAAE